MVWEMACGAQSKSPVMDHRGCPMLSHFVCISVYEYGSGLPQVMESDGMSWNWIGVMESNGMSWNFEKFAMCHGMSWEMKRMESILQNLLNCTICFLDFRIFLRGQAHWPPQECFKCHGKLRFLSWNVMEMWCPSRLLPLSHQKQEDIFRYFLENVGEKTISD